MTERPSLVVFDLDHTLSRRDTFLQYLGGFLLRNPARILRCIGLPFAVAKFYLGLIDNRQMKESFLSAVLGGIHRQEVEAWTKRYVPHQTARRSLHLGGSGIVESTYCSTPRTLRFRHYGV